MKIILKSIKIRCKKKFYYKPIQLYKSNKLHARHQITSISPVNPWRIPPLMSRIAFHPSSHMSLLSICSLHLNIPIPYMMCAGGVQLQASPFHMWTSLFNKNRRGLHPKPHSDVNGKAYVRSQNPSAIDAISS